LLCSLPLIAAAALVIKWRSPGPAFYAQKRVGLDGRTIHVWKLRTMHMNADKLLEQHLAHNLEAWREWNKFFKLRNDPRIIPGVGHFLRRTSLDELPQFWNIMKGDMGLVGPRPFPEYHLAEFPEEFRKLRCSVLPGLTGLWQVSRRSDGDLLVQQALDTYLIRNWSVWLEFWVLARTVRSVLGRSGAY
jgi:lipopolysaccharide/colanic/teichoic acid biosynthesis glycosyltransferase